MVLGIYFVFGHLGPLVQGTTQKRKSLVDDSQSLSFDPNSLMILGWFYSQQLAESMAPPRRTRITPTAYQHIYIQGLVNIKKVTWDIQSSS